MLAFTPILPLPCRGAASFARRPAPSIRARAVPLAALRPGWGLHSPVERVPLRAATPPPALTPLRDDAIPAELVAPAEVAAPTEPAPRALPSALESDLARAPLLQRLARTLVRLSAALRAFRERHMRALRMARLALGALIAFGVFAARGGRGGAAFAGTSGASVASAPGAATAAMPGVLSALRVPDGIVRTIRPFTESFGVVFLSEFGDKSMFATALMAMKHSPVLVLIGALAALTVMTLIACFLGQLMHLLPSSVTHYSSIALFVFFGFQMIMQSRNLPSTPGGSGGERADAEELVAGSAIAVAGAKQSPLAILAKISSLIFVAEWCDRSMIATMALAASSNSLAVVGGATLANVVCTGVAVGAAAIVASRISERTVALIAGVLFEFFAVFTFFEGPES